VVLQVGSARLSKVIDLLTGEGLILQTFFSGLTAFSLCYYHVTCPLTGVRVQRLRLAMMVYIIITITCLHNTRSSVLLHLLQIAVNQKTEKAWRMSRSRYRNKFAAEAEGDKGGGRRDMCMRVDKGPILVLPPISTFLSCADWKRPESLHGR
jgi:hypothetical protein